MNITVEVCPGHMRLICPEMLRWLKYARQRYTKDDLDFILGVFPPVYFLTPSLWTHHFGGDVLALHDMRHDPLGAIRQSRAYERPEATFQAITSELPKARKALSSWLRLGSMPR